MACHKQISVIKNTLFENSKIALHKWFLAIFLASRDKRGVSAMTLSRELELARPTTMEMLRELRTLMAVREQAYQLSGMIEVDEFFIGASGGKQGRGTSKSKGLIALSYQTIAKDKITDEFLDVYQDSTSEEFNNDDYELIDIPMYCKMLVVESVDAKAINQFVADVIEPGSFIITDGHQGYNQLIQTGNQRLSTDFDPNEAKFHHLHIVISNLKSFVLGTYHGLGPEYLQTYLDEFCYRFNRRKLHETLFDRLLQLALKMD
jgi:transposase-like protein